MHFAPFVVAALSGLAVAAPIPAGLVVLSRGPLNTDIMQAGLGLVSGDSDFGLKSSPPLVPVPRAQATDPDILLPPLERRVFNSGAVSDVLPVALNKRQLNTGQIGALPVAPVAPAPVPAVNYILPPPSL